MTIEELKTGYHKVKEGYECQICHAFFSEEEVYSVQGHLYLAKAAVKHHIKSIHGGMFDVLLSRDKKEHSLTDNQKTLFQYVKEGKSDKEIAQLTNTSPSTIRHQRFVFKEKANQARIYLALYELATEKEIPFVPIHATAKQVDDRFITSEKEEQQVIDHMFSSLQPLKLKQFPAKEKKKITVLRMIMQGFHAGNIYTEDEINTYLKEIFDDYVTLRRYLIEYGFLDRTMDCKEYWVKEK